MTTPTVDGLLRRARQDLGYSENPPGSNRNKFSDSWGQPPEPWCADAVTRWLADAGALDVPRSSYTPALAIAYADAGRFGRDPHPGAVVFFQWPGMGRIAHVGVVEGVRPDGSIVTIEGNTDEAGGRTGGKVMRKVRRANIAGYGYPKYAAAAAPARKVDRLLGITNPPMRGQDVLNVQRALNRLGNHLAETGVYDRATADLVGVFQRNRHIIERGVGPLTWQALRKKTR